MRTGLKRFIGAAVTVGLCAGLTAGCATTSAQPGFIGVVVDDYAFIPTPPVLLGCIQPETNQSNWVNNVHFYPARQISWDATGGTDSERGPYVVVSNRDAPAEMLVPVTVTMDLTTDCELLKEFHRRLGTKYNAWVDAENTNNNNPSIAGWISLLNYAVGQPLEIRLQRIAQKYPWQKIWNDEAVRLEFEQTLQSEIERAVRDRTGTVADGDNDPENDPTFFTNFKVTVGKPDPKDENLKKALADQQTAVAKADSARLAADAQVATAIAETGVAKQQALKRQAEIAGYPTVDDYLRALAIDKGMNPWQPTYVVPGSAPLPAPAR